MIRCLFLTLFSLFFMVSAAVASDVVVLGETPVPEFSLPDGSVIKNAFVWRRSSEGLMIVHDDGQYFLNFALLSGDWKVAYLGAPVEATEIPAEDEELDETSDPFHLLPILETIPQLTESGRSFLLRKGADEASQQQAFALGILQSLLGGKAEDANRFILLVEEMEYEVEGVARDDLFVTCESCKGKGRVEKLCERCDGTGTCLKCDGEGQRESAFGGSSSVHCTSCRGEGDCRECAGAGSETVSCRVCRGRGKLLEKQACEIKRDFYVHTVNQLANPEIKVSIFKSDAAQSLRMLKSFPELEPGAVNYFSSDAYTGGVDDKILVAATLNALLAGDMKSARCFHTMLQVFYGADDELAIDTYLKPCVRCKKTGRIERDCRACEGSGDCARCEGDGEQESEFRNTTTECLDCKASGECKSCEGEGRSMVRCGACGGTGRKLEKERTEAKLQLMVVQLNQFSQAQQP